MSTIEERGLRSLYRNDADAELVYKFKEPSSVQFLQVLVRYRQIAFIISHSLEFL